MLLLLCLLHRTCSIPSQFACTKEGGGGACRRTVPYDEDSGKWFTMQRPKKCLGLGLWDALLFLCLVQQEKASAFCASSTEPFFWRGGGSYRERDIVTSKWCNTVSYLTLPPRPEGQEWHKWCPAGMKCPPIRPGTKETSEISGLTTNFSSVSSELKWRKEWIKWWNGRRKQKELRDSNKLTKCSWVSLTCGDVKQLWMNSLTK